MKNQVSEGKTLNWTNNTAGTIASGDPVLVGSILAVAMTDAGIGDTAAVALEGVYTLPKVSAESFVQGEKLRFDISEKKLTTTAGAAGDLSGAAIAHQSAIAGATTVQAKIGFLGELV